MRSVIFRYEDLAALASSLAETHGSLPLPRGEAVNDGEWVLAIFEIGSRRRATAAAARGVRASGDTHLEFERRDWDRLVAFVVAKSGQSEHMRTARPAHPTSSARMPIASGGAHGRGEDEIAPPSVARMASAPIEVAPLERARKESEVPRSRRLDDAIPPSSALESTRIPFGARVLVVDDGTGDEVRAMLAEIGLVVELVATTKRATQRMEAKSFDAIVLDLHAPDSRAFVAKIRESQTAHADTLAVCDIPVLFLSSRPTSRDVVDAFASGGDDFLPKPFRTPELAARIFGLLRRARLAKTTPKAGGSSR